MGEICWDFNHRFTANSLLHVRVKELGKSVIIFEPRGNCFMRVLLCCKLRDHVGLGDEAS